LILTSAVLESIFCDIEIICFLSTLSLWSAI
jgi:hypothetical protein